MKKFSIFLITSITFSGLAHSEDSMCTGSEKVLFSCISGKKTISLCGSPNYSLNSGYVRYKFGVPGKEPELIYPQDDRSLSQAFHYSYDDYSKGSTQELSFARGKYKYTVHVDAHAIRGSASGLVVEVNGERVAYLKCDKYQDPDALYWARQAEMPEDRPRYIGRPSE